MRFLNRAIFLALILHCPLSLELAHAASPAAGAICFDFESGDLQGWEIVEGEFDYLVSDRATYHNAPQEKYNKQGKYYLSTVEQQPGMPSNDRMTGVVESPVFRLTEPTMNFLIGGGTAQDTYVALCTLDGAEVIQERGRNTEVMRRIHWRLPQLVGKLVFLRIADRNSGSWGYMAFDDFSARGAVDPKATRQRALIREKAQAEQMRKAMAERCRPLRLAIEDLLKTFPDDYPRGKTFLSRLNTLERQAESANAERLVGIGKEVEALSREALIANPLVSGQPIAFVVRAQYRSHYHAIDTLFHTGEFNVDKGIPHSDLFQGGGALKTIDFSAGGAVKTLVDVPEGIARDPQVHFDGGKIVFALRRDAREDYHIWQVQADGEDLRQITSAQGVSDFDPIYLPDDGIVFSSTREPKYNMCSRDIAANLFRMEADGANIHQITKNTLFDNHGELMADGRILYARWEYVDRNFGDAHGLWTVNPDGTNQAIYWGNNTAVPGAVFNAHVIPGTQQVLCILGPHHDRLWGAMAIIDRRLGMDGRPGVLRTWPPEAIQGVRANGEFDCDFHQRTVRVKYEDPWPLSDKYFLCSRMTGQGERTGIYLVDIFGNETLLHSEGLGCYDPMPVRPSPRPPVIPSRRDFTNHEGRFFVADVYAGTHMKGVKRGSVKSLRVIESPEKRHWSRGSWNGQGYTAPGMNWHSLENKRILGDVSVEEDGSAYFVVPSDKFVYFQLLDENRMMIQSMRSGTVIQSGEQTGCIGCHDNRRAAPAAINAPTLALQRPPSQIEEWYGKPRLFGFTTEVQPVFNKHCVSCHDFGKKPGAKLNLAPDPTLAFNVAYHELWRKGYLQCVGGGPAEVQNAYSWGSHASKLLKEIDNTNREEHRDIRLSREDRDRLKTWMDLNAVYYSTYACAYPESRTGRSPLDAQQLERLSGLTGVPFSQQMSYNANPGPMVSFDRPELSPCLSKFQKKDAPEYLEALAIIQAGKRQLAARPRADMPGFEPCQADQEREKRYASRQRIELRNRNAIRSGRKAYD